MDYMRSKGFNLAANDLDVHLLENNNSNSTNKAVDSKIEHHFFNISSKSEVNSERYHDEYSKLRSYCSTLTLYKHELFPVLYGIFIHCFMDMLAKGDVQHAKNFFSKYRVDHCTQRDLQKLEALRSSNFLEVPTQQDREFVRSLRLRKVDVAISQCTHKLLMQYVNRSEASLMQRIIEKRINFKVSPELPVTNSKNIQDACSQKRLPSVKNKLWTREEDEALCKAYMFIYANGSPRTKRTMDGFWISVTKKFYEFYKRTLPPSNRNCEGCHARWRKQILPHLKKWHAASKKAERLNMTIGFDKECMTEKFYKEDVDKPFNYHGCWEICKDLVMSQDLAIEMPTIQKKMIIDLDEDEETSLISHAALQTNTSNTNTSNDKNSSNSFDLKVAPDLSKPAHPLAQSADDPAKYHYAYGKLRSWTFSSLDIYKHELLHVLYPVFIHCFMDVVGKGHKEEARTFFDSYHKDHGSMWLKDLQIFEGLSPSYLEGSEFARSLRQKKIEVNICQYSYGLLLQYLHKTESTLVLRIINEHINFKVSPGRPPSFSNATETKPIGIANVKDDPPQAQVQDSILSLLRQKSETKECENNDYLKKIASALEMIVKQNDIQIEEKRRRYEERKRDRREKMDDYIMALNTKDMTPLSNTYFQGKKRKIMERRGRILYANADSESDCTPTTSAEDSL